MALTSGGHLPAGRPAVGGGHPRGQAPGVRVHPRLTARRHAHPRHAPAAPPQDCRQHRHPAQCESLPCSN